jgi:hypothetical protein
MALDFKEFTSQLTIDVSEGTLTGGGIFDKTMEAITKHLKAQYQSSAITGTEYSTVYLGAMQTAIQTAAKVFLEYQLAEDQSNLVKEQKNLVVQQILESTAKTELIESQKLTEDLKHALVAAQTLGFKTDAKLKVLAKQMEVWGIYFAVVQLGDPPNSVTSQGIDDLHASILADLDP